MASLLEKLQKNSKIKDSAILSESRFYNKKIVVPTDIPALNIALGGELDGGITPGWITIAGPSRHFKSSIMLKLVAAYLKAKPKAMCLFYDSEFGSPATYFESFGINPERVYHAPLTDIEQFKFDVMSQLNGLEDGDEIIIAADSFGNLASKKEVEDALKESGAADMTRAKAFKSLGRMITPHLTMKSIPMIIINHTYKTQEMYAKDVVSGGCLLAGHKIQTNRGLVNIEEITLEDKVVTLDGFKPVTAVWNPETLAEGTPECFRITFEDGYTVDCSDKHQFLVEGNWWIQAKYLMLGHYVQTAGECKVQVKTVTPIGRHPVYDISVSDAEHYVLENGVVTHNTGIFYSSNTVIIVGRQQDKDGADLVGYNFILNIEKSRFVREKSKIPLSVTFKEGIEKYSGLLDIALEGGFIIKPKMGWYQVCDPKTKQPKEGSYREADTYCDEVWDPILASEEFKQYIRDKYKLQSHAKIVSEIEDESV